MGLKDRVKRIVKAVGKTTTGDRMYLYDTKENRENTISYLVEYAKTSKSAQTIKMRMLDDYYNNKHKTQLEIQKTCLDRGLPFVPAIIPEPYIHVESQIIPDIPTFEFSGRDGDLDSSKAKIREYVVQYVCDNNKLEAMNPDNERRLRKLGNAFFKVSFDAAIKGHGFTGDIVIGTPDPSEIFPDPSAFDLDDCEYVDYIYRLHKMKAARVFKNELKKLDLTVHELKDEGIRGDTEIYNSQTQDMYDDTLQITEHWFRQPVEGSDTKEYEVYDDLTGKNKTIKRTVTWEAGDIACSILIGGTEVKYIPKYWEETDCKMYPFVKYCTIPNNKTFWDKSEIEPIIELVDAADRELSIAILNDAFSAGDIILMEENTLADGTEIENIPNSIWKTKPGQINNVRRLGGLSNLNGGLRDTIDFIRDIIKQTVGNFDVNMGDAPPGNVKTLGGLVELKEQGNKRQNIKKQDRKMGFERLFELIDQTAIEFYDDNRLIFLGATKPNATQAVDENGKPNMDRSKGPVSFNYNARNMAILDDNNNDPKKYYPRIDSTINVGDGITNSKAFTLSALENISKTAVTPQNYKILQSMVDIMNLPDRKDMKEFWENMFSHPPEEKKDTPNISISYKDLPQDAQIQLLQQIGIQSQGGINPMQGEPQQELDFKELFKSLSHDELLHLEQNPQLLEEFIKSQGGVSNAMPQM